jgi:hypothetical protein
MMVLFVQVKLQGGEVIGAPTPADVMASASRTVLTKLDRVEGAVIDFFMPAATRLIAGPQPERVLAAALAAMSGFRWVPPQRPSSSMLLVRCSNLAAGYCLPLSQLNCQKGNNRCSRHGVRVGRKNPPTL